MQREPKYFMANFGTEHADKHPVNGGHYPVPSIFNAPKIISKSDTMLLCCWGGYEECWGDICGLGTVTYKEKQAEKTIVYYDYELWLQPIRRAAIYDCLTEEERRKFKVPHYKANWLFEIEPTSFQCIVNKAKSTGDKSK